MKIEFHYTYLIIAISFILTGYFSNLLVFTSIIIIHELGHYLTAYLLKLNPRKIIIYPFGGITKLNIPLNTPIYKELIVSISGIIFQTSYLLIIIYLYQNNHLREYIYNQYITYNYNILVFNILPIYPLDGSKILNLILYKIFPYKLSNLITIIISLITLIFLLIINYYQFNYTIILIISILITNIYKYYKTINYLLNKLLLERYLYKYEYNSLKKISNINHLYKEKRHLIKENNTYITEKSYLIRKFSNKYKKNI